MSQRRSFWLMKSDPGCFSIHHLAECPGRTTCWSGVRNYQARNFMRDQMKLGDGVLFYHSGGATPAVAGTAVVVRQAYPDHTAWDPRDQHFDPKALPDKPIWQMVDIRLEAIFVAPIPLEMLRKMPTLESMELLRKGSRLSVQPVTPREFEVIVELSRRAGPTRASGKTAKKAAVKTR
ncbi:MAG: EVE domain-containing protein [Planctomycetia bacterium]|nr:EVE domain-containing protein [Planctomycetia bacterium]